MHGRLKVRTSAEEAERKRKEQEEKLKVYLPCLDRIYQKRANNELDAELMSLTGRILSSNPDYYTLWNIRKECLLKFLEENKDDSEIFNKDLEFTEHCLRVNPKSYGAWHHRCWILENSPEKDFMKEVNLCTRYLKLDERNFHCWDYRRFVVEKAEVTSEDELKFCTEKIQQNFSNYSSWHYRSKLLPNLYPHESDPRRPINEEILKKELEMVLTAAFTDPKDSSAWFYQRWLLGYSEPNLNLASFYLSNEKAIISFTKATNLVDFDIDIPFANPLINDPKSWKSTNGLIHDHTWFFTGHDLINNSLSNENDLQISVKSENFNFSLKIHHKNSEFYGIQLPKFEFAFGEGVKEELKNQLDSCNQLLEFEPDSKWTLLTAALLMRAIDRKLYHEQTLEFLEKLQKVDLLRDGYYKDLASKWNIEHALDNWVNSCDIELPVKLSGLKLTCLYYDQYLSAAKRIDLSQNDLKDKKLKCKVKTFQNCNELILRGNTGAGKVVDYCNGSIKVIL